MKVEDGNEGEERPAMEGRVGGQWRDVRIMKRMNRLIPMIEHAAQAKSSPFRTRPRLIYVNEGRGVHERLPVRKEVISYLIFIDEGLLCSNWSVELM